MKHIFFDAQTYEDCVLNSIYKTLSVNFGENKSIYFIVDGKNYVSKLTGRTLSAQFPFEKIILVKSEWIGTWNFSKTDEMTIVSGTLVISNIKDNSFNFSLEVVGGNINSPHTGLIDGVAKIEDAKKATYRESDGTEIRFDLKDNSIVVTANEIARKYCGARANFNLEYTKK